jgi:hypothetical protein
MRCDDEVGNVWLSFSAGANEELYDDVYNKGTTGNKRRERETALQPPTIFFIHLDCAASGIAVNPDLIVKVRLELVGVLDVCDGRRCRQYRKKKLEGGERNEQFDWLSLYCLQLLNTSRAS